MLSKIYIHLQAALLIKFIKLLIHFYSCKYSFAVVVYKINYALILIENFIVYLKMFLFLFNARNVVEKKCKNIKIAKLFYLFLLTVKTFYSHKMCCIVCTVNIIQVQLSLKKWQFPVTLKTFFLITDNCSFCLMIIINKIRKT